MWVKKTPTPFIICGIVAVTSLLIGICIPILLHNILKRNMKEAAILSRYSPLTPRNNYDFWSAIPGKHNFDYRRQITLYKLAKISGDQVQLLTGPRLNYTIDRNISWTELIDSVQLVSP